MANLSWNKIGASYILAIWVICQFVDLSEIIKGFLAQPLLFLVPYLFGSAVSILFKIIFRNLEFKFDNISKGIIFWCIGIVSMLLFALLLNTIHLFDIDIYVFLILVMILLGSIYKENVAKKNKNIVLSNNYLISNKILILIFIIGIIPAIYTRQYSPFPLIPMSDAFSTSYFTLRIIENNYFTFAEAYLPAVPILLSVSMTILNNQLSNAIPIFWASSFFLYPIYAFGLYLFSYQISKNTKLSLIAVIVGIWAFPKDMALEYGPLPRIIIHIIFPFFLFIIHKYIIDKFWGNKELKINIKNREIVFMFFILSVLSLLMFLILVFSYKPPIREIVSPLIIIWILLITFIAKRNIVFKNEFLKMNFLIMSMMLITFLVFHIPMGFMAMFIILLYLFISILRIYYPNITNLLICFFILFVISSLLLQQYEIIILPEVSQIINPYNAPDRPAPNFDYYYNALLTGAYSKLTLILLIFGSVFTIFDIRSYKNMDYRINTLFLTAFILFVFSLPISNSIYRILFCATPFIAYLAAYAIMVVYNILGCWFKPSYKRYMVGVYFLIISVILLLSVISPHQNELDYYLSQKGTHGEYSVFTQNEYETGKWIRYNTQKNTLIITDYSTQRKMLGLSNRNGFLRDSFPNQEIIHLLSTTNSTYAHTIITNMLLNNSLTCIEYESKENCINTKDIDVIIVIDGRTSNFINHKRTDGLWFPQDFKHFEGFDKFYNSTYFTPLYNADNHTYVFGVNPEPGVPFKTIGWVN